MVYNLHQTIRFAMDISRGFQFLDAYRSNLIIFCQIPLISFIKFLRHNIYIYIYFSAMKKLNQRVLILALILLLIE